jgi:hypothetical protein
LLLLQSKEFPPSEAQGGCFFFGGGGGGGAHKLPHRVVPFLVSGVCFFPFGSGLCFENLHFDFLHLVKLICSFVCFGELLLLLWDLEKFHAFFQVLFGFGF